MLKPALALPQPSKKDPSQLLLMPLTGHPTNPEFSLTAEPDLTTVLPLLEPVTAAGGLRTHGDPHGERRDTSESNPETPAVSATLPLTPTNDCDNIINPYSFILNP